MKRIDWMVAALVATGVLWLLTSRVEAEEQGPRPPGGKTTREWVIGEKIPYLARTIQDHKWGKILTVRTGWAYRLSSSFQLANQGAGLDGCPASLEELKSSRFVPFTPIDRFERTPLSGDFLREATYTLPQGRKNLHSALDDIQKRFPEGTVIFSKRASGSEMAIVYYHQDDTGGKPAAFAEFCTSRKAGSAAPSAVFQSGLLWRLTAENVAGYVKAYVAYTGKSPTDIKDLDGTVARLNPKAWNDPEIGPILKQISEKLLPLVQKSLKPEPAMGEFEPISAG